MMSNIFLMSWYKYFPSLQLSVSIIGIIPWTEIHGRKISRVRSYESLPRIAQDLRLLLTQNDTTQKVLDSMIQFFFTTKYIKLTARAFIIALKTNDQ